MRAKPPKRLEAERLRCDEGLSYSEIASQLGVNKSTLSHWLRDLALSDQHKERLQERLVTNRRAFAARAWPINRQRHLQARQSAYDAGFAITTQLPDATAVHEIAFAMLYLGEGTKAGNRVMLGSTTPAILRYTIWALETLYGVEDGKIIYRLHLIAAAEHLEGGLRRWWSDELGVSLEQFQATTYDRRPREVILTQDYHGVCSVLCLDTALQQRILGVAHGYLASILNSERQITNPPINF
jgi:transposase-like protein